MRKTFFYTALFIFCWVYSILFNNIDWDLWARLSVGKIFSQIGTVLKNDIFSYTTTKAMWVDHEWGSGVVFYFMSHHFGDAGLMFLKIFMFFLIMILISQIIKLQNTEKDNSYLNLGFYYLIFLGLFFGVGATIRCQEFTFLFFTLFIYILERVRRGEIRLLWTIPTLMLIWANLHGGFVSGIGLLVIYGIGEFLNKKPCKKYFLILIPTLLVTLVNPYGYKYLEYIIQATTMSRPTITEWRPTPIFGVLGDWKGYKIVLLTAIITVLFNIFRKRPEYKGMDKVKFILLLVTLYLSLKHIKHQAFFAIAVGSFLYYDFYSIFNTIRDLIIKKFGESYRIILKNIAKGKDILVYTFIMTAGCILIFMNPVQIEVYDNLYPVGSFEFIKQNKLSGNLLTVFHWGSYAIWKLYPQCLVAIDGRYEEVYPDELNEIIYRFMYKDYKNREEIIKKYHTDIMVLDKYNYSYLAALHSKDWKQIYEDKKSAVFVPRSKARKSYIIPKYNTEYFIKDKYNTSINFLD